MKSISTENAPKAIGPYVQGKMFEGLIFTSGQLGINPKTNKLCNGIDAQTRQALDNLSAVLLAGGSNMESVIITTVLLTNIDDFNVVNEIYSDSFRGVFPARVAYQVGALPMGGLIEIEAIAVQDK